MKIRNLTSLLICLFALPSCSHLETELLGFNTCGSIKFSFDKNIEVISKEDLKNCRLIKEGLTIPKCVEIYPAKKQYVLKLKKQAEFHGGNALFLTQEDEDNRFGDAYFCPTL